MCFTIHRRHPKIKVAKRGITCWKIFNDRWHAFSEPVWHGFRSEYLDFVYNFDKLYTDELGILDEGEIEKGFHSYSTIDKALNMKVKNQSYVECFIPIGAKYYYNPKTREYVSDSIYIMDSTFVNKKYSFSFKRMFEKVAFLFNQF